MRVTASQKLLERAACLKMALFLALGGMVFALLPNTNVFQRLAVNGFTYGPGVLSIANFAGAATYLWLADSDFAWMLKSGVREIIFFVASLPIVAYLLPAGLISIATNATVNALSYIFIYFIMLLLITAIYQGWSKRLETVVLAILSVYMFLTAYIFQGTLMLPASSANPSLNGDGTVFIFHLPIMVFFILALLGGTSYLLLLTPLRSLITQRQYRLWFIVSEAVIPLYALFQLANSLITGGAWLVPVALIDLYFLIALIHYALYRDLRAWGAGAQAE